MAPASPPTLAFRYGAGEKGQGVGDDGRRALRQPRGFHVCEDGTLLVADFGNHCVVKFEPEDAKGQIVAGEEGRTLPEVDPLKDIDRPLGPPEGEGVLLKRPLDVCVDSEGAFLVLDADEGRLQRFRAPGRDVAAEPARTVVPPGGAPSNKSAIAPDAIKHPRAAIVAPDGSIVVCDTWSHRVLRFPPGAGQGAVARPEVIAGAPNSAGASAEKLSFPSCAVFAPDGTLLVADTNNHRVQRFEKGCAVGTTVAGSAQGARGASLEELDMPTGLCVDPRDGSFLVADRANARVLRFPAAARAGDTGELVAGPELLERPWGVALGPDRSIFVSDERRATVLKLEIDASVTATSATPGRAAEASPVDNPMELD